MVVQRVPFAEFVAVTMCSCPVACLPCAPHVCLLCDFLFQTTVFLRRSSKWILVDPSWLSPSVDWDVGCSLQAPTLAAHDFGTPPKPTSRQRRGKKQAAKDDARQQTSPKTISYRTLKPQIPKPLTANKKQPRQRQVPPKPFGSNKSRGSSSWHSFVKENFNTFGQTAGAVDGSSASQQDLALPLSRQATKQCFGDRIRSIAKAWKQRARPSAP